MLQYNKQKWNASGVRISASHRMDASGLEVQNHCLQGVSKQVAAMVEQESP